MKQLYEDFGERALMTPAGAGQTSILVIDDDPVITDLMASILRPEGYEVHTANCGKQGMALAAQLKPNIVFVDITMPDLDGYAVTERLKNDPATAKLPIIYVSGRTAAEDNGRSFASGGLAFFRKPFSAKQLRDLVALTLMSI
jgi:CheY-like chemotaxis protein